MSRHRRDDLPLDADIELATAAFEQRRAQLVHTERNIKKLGKSIGMWLEAMKFSNDSLCELSTGIAMLSPPALQATNSALCEMATSLAGFMDATFKQVVQSVSGGAQGGGDSVKAWQHRIGALRSKVAQRDAAREQYVHYSAKVKRLRRRTLDRLDRGKTHHRDRHSKVSRNQRKLRVATANFVELNDAVMREVDRETRECQEAFTPCFQQMCDMLSSYFHSVSTAIEALRAELGEPEEAKAEEAKAPSPPPPTAPPTPTPVVVTQEPEPERAPTPPPPTAAPPAPTKAPAQDQSDDKPQTMIVHGDVQQPPPPSGAFANRLSDGDGAAGVAMGEALAAAAAAAAASQQLYSTRHYDNLGQLGSGSFGTTHLVRDARNDGLYVLKKIACQDVSEANGALQEAIALSRFSSQRVVTFRELFLEHDPGAQQLFVVIAMEYLHRGDLQRRVAAARAPFPEEDLLQTVREIVEAVAEVHAGGFVHRDLKPANLLLGDTGIKLADFGVSKLLGRTIERAHTRIGTPAYMAPEVLSNRAYDRKADIWSIGCITYELATLSPPDFHLRTLDEVLETVPTHYSPLVRELIASTLNLDPAQRPEASDILARLGGAAGGALPAPPPAVPRPDEVRRELSAESWTSSSSSGSDSDDVSDGVGDSDGEDDGYSTMSSMSSGTESESEL